ncbi:MAG: hypothetical protein ACMXYD_02175 [Candidatus Woesearchaeota archaeon]
MNEEQQDFLDDAVNELKRVEHLVFVSLKYTRTVDVLLNIISRQIDGYEAMWNALLTKLVEEKKIPSIPEAPVPRANALMQHYMQHPEILENVELYILLRKLHRSNPEREQEFRRHVAMRTVIDGREEVVNIDIITQYAQIQKEFVKWLYTFLEK